MDPSRPVLIVSPHLDDAVLSCWSVLNGGVPVKVVNLFCGLPGANAPLASWDRLTGASSSRERMVERIREDAAALRSVDVEPVNFDFLDAQYRRGDMDVKPLVDRLLPYARAACAIYAPAAIGANPDHVLVRYAGIALLRRGLPVTLYGELPYSNELGWPHWVDGGPQDPFLDVTSQWQQYLNGAGVPIDAHDATVERLSPEAQAEKLAALRSYETQLPGLDRGDAHALTGGGRLAYEVFWPLEPPSMSRRAARRYELLWQLGVRHGSRLERVSRHSAFRRLRAPGRRGDRGRG